MPKYTVTALEKFLVKTIYINVEANSPEQAAELVRRGNIGYSAHSIEEGDDEWVALLDVEEEKE